MQGIGMVGVLVEDNYVQGCGWHDVEKSWETGGIKLHQMRHTLVRRNIINGTIGAPGIWLDFNLVNARLTKNIITGVRSDSYGGIFIEASF